MIVMLCLHPLSPNLEAFPLLNNLPPLKNPSFFARAYAFKQHLQEKDTINKQIEFERYLSDPCSLVGEKFDILIWWKQNCARYFILAAIVREILVEPVSTVAL